MFQRQRPRSAIQAATEPEVLIYDEIGFFGIMAKDLVPEIKALQADTIHVRLNSPGGDVPDGVAIYNALRAHSARIVVHVDALAASIASLIAMAGDEILMAANAFLMIHNVWGITIGNAADHRAMATVLDKMDQEILLSAYRNQTGASEEQVKRWMAAETWFSAGEAEQAGFIDAVEDPAGVSASFDLTVFQHVPAALAHSQREVPDVRSLERVLREAGLSRMAAKAVLAKGYGAIADDPAPPREAAGADLLASSQQLLSSLRA